MRIEPMPFRRRFAAAVVTSLRRRFAAAVVTSLRRRFAAAVVTSLRRRFAAAVVVRWVQIGIAGLILGIGAGASAQQKPKRAPKVIQLEEIRIEGRVQKPNAFYILNRSNLGYEVMDLRTSFIRDIVRAVHDDSF
jgi:hypothetical protein